MPDDRSLGVALMRSLWNAGGWPAMQNVVGVGKHLATRGLPESASVEDGRLVLRGGAGEPETVGDVISLPAGSTPIDLEHERRHTIQADVLGPAMLAMKPIEAFYPYGQGPLERDAYAATEPTTEFLRREPGAFASLAENVLGRFGPRRRRPAATMQAEGLTE